MITDLRHSAAKPSKRRGGAPRRTAISLTALPLVFTLPSAAGAHPSEAPNDDRPAIISVIGSQVPVDADQGMYRMRGDLLGRWVVLSAVTLPPGYYETEAQWRVVQTGRRQFVGCLDRNHNRRCDSSDISGELRFDYLLWIKYDPKTGRPIEGKCVHPLPAARKISPVHAAYSRCTTPLPDMGKSIHIKEKSCSTPSTTNQLRPDRAAPIDLSPRKHERPDAEAGTWPSSVRLAQTSRGGGGSFTRPACLQLAGSDPSVPDSTVPHR